MFDKSVLSRRAFTVQSLDNLECLILKYSDLDIMKKDFPTQMNQFVKSNIEQTVNIMCQLMHMIEHYDATKNNLNSDLTQTSQSDNSLDSVRKNNIITQRKVIKSYQLKETFVFEWTDDEESESEEESVPQGEAKTANGDNSSSP